ncbi:MAG: LamG domain-containing protein, partial [Cellvibrionaceae bacterium]|nr:LamG domain-containing protein [Cellvibrionaceae bacterium]
AFVVTAIDNLGNDIVAGRAHDFRVAMFRQDPLSGACSPSGNYSASAVKVWLRRAVSDPGAAAPVLRSTAATSSVSPGNALPAGNNFSLPFINGVADFSLEASDVGRYSLQFHDDSLSFSEQVISGGSASFFTVRPFGFSLGVTANPAAEDANGGVFIAAGSDFSLTVTAVAWQAADDSDDNGAPDGHAPTNSDPGDNANLSDNMPLASFGLETPAETVTLSHRLVAPATGTGSFLSSTVVDARVVTNFTNGVGTTSAVYFDEVGIIELQAAVSDGDYLGAGGFSLLSASQSGYVGRFIPARFSLNNNRVDAACSSVIAYSYLGENFALAYQLEALNSLDAIVSNYQGAFVKLGGSRGAISAGARDAASAVDLSARIDSAAANLLAASTFNWNSGTAQINTTLHVNRASAPDGPFQAVDFGVLVSDSDGVSFAAADLTLDVDNNGSNDFALIGSSGLRFGRLRLGDAFGPETHNLPVNFLVEYWDGRLWRRHLDDSCTSIVRSAISYPSGTIDNPANLNIALGSATTSGSYAAASASDIQFIDGDAGQFFSAPGAGNTGSFAVDIDLNLYPWLRYDWDNNGSYNDSALPSARFNFGSYRGHDRIIYWQEVLH